MGGRTVALYTFTLAFIVFWWVFGPTDPPDHFFVEGGAIDWVSTVYMLTAAMLSWVAWLVGPRRGEPGSWFWLVSAMGFIFLLIDERFQLHEHILSEWQQPIWGDVPFGLRNWNDLVVILYGPIALIVAALALPAVLRYRRFRFLLGVAFVLFVAHTVLDSINVFNEDAEDAAEESCKLLSVATLVLAWLQATLCRADDGAAAAIPGAARRLIRWPHTAIVVVIAAAAGALLMYEGEDWQEELQHKWGYPVLWLITVQLGAAAMFAWLAGVRERRASVRWSWYGVAAALIAVAADQATIACQYRFFHRDVDGFVREVLLPVVGVYQTPIGVWKMLVVVGLVLAGVTGTRLLWRDRFARWAWPIAMLLLILPALIARHVGRDIDGRLVAGWLVLAAATVLCITYRLFADTLRPPHTTESRSS